MHSYRIRMTGLDDEDVGILGVLFIELGASVELFWGRSGLVVGGR